MRSLFVRASVLGVTLACAACGGGDGGPSSPTPTPTPGATVNIAGDLGNQSFNPNPAAPGSALTVSWRNADGVVHRIVANDNSFDTGNISPNGTSATVTAPAGGVNYHCSIHPGMVGAINGTGGTAPPCTGQYC